MVPKLTVTYILHLVDGVSMLKKHQTLPILSHLLSPYNISSLFVAVCQLRFRQKQFLWFLVVEMLWPLQKLDQEKQEHLYCLFYKSYMRLLPCLHSNLTPGSSQLEWKAVKSSLCISRKKQNSQCIGWKFCCQLLVLLRKRSVCKIWGQMNCDLK